MITKILNPSQLAAVLGLLVCLAGCDRPTADADPHFSLTIRAMSTEIVVGEPITLEVTLKNTGEEALSVARSLSKTSDNATYLILSGNAEPRRLGMSMSLPHVPLLELAPDEERRHIEWLHGDWVSRAHGGQTLAMNSPGVYTILMQYETPSDQEGEFWRITSNGVIVTVTEPDPAWTELVEILADPQLSSRIDQGMPRTRGSSRFQFGSLYDDGFSGQRDEKLEHLAASDSPYAPYASMLRGGYELAGFERLDTFEATIDGEEARALRALEHLKPADIDGFPLRSEVVWHMREAAILLGDDEAVESLNKRLETEFADTHATKRPSEIMKYKQGLR